MGWGKIIFAVWLLSFLNGFAESSPEEKKITEDDKIEAKATDHAVEKSLTLSMGVSRIIELKFDIGPIDLGDSNLFDIQRIDEGNQRIRKLRLVPKNPGYTNMTIQDLAERKPRVTYLVRVTREDVGQVISQLEELLGDIEGIKIKGIGGTVVIDGDILLPKDMMRIIRVVDALKDRDPKKKDIPIKNIANISKVTMGIIAERIEREINNPEISARVLNNNVILEGTANGNDDADRNLAIAKTYLPEAFVEKNKGEGYEVKLKAEGGAGGTPTIIDFQRIRPGGDPEPEKDIKVTMNFVELNNEYQKAFNFEWKPLGTDQSNINLDSVNGFTSSLVATVSSLFPKLTTARDHGHARVLKQQALIVKNGSDQPAAVDSSLQIFITTTDERGNRNAQPVNIQNATKVRARIIKGSDSIELGLQVNLSSLISVSNGTPAIASNSLQTQIIVKNGESVALGGNMVDQALAGYNREPSASGQQSTAGGAGGGGGGGTPLFNLKRSKSYTHNKNQYIIFVTPEILRSAGAGTEDLTRKFRLNAGER